MNRKNIKTIVLACLLSSTFVSYLIAGDVIVTSHYRDEFSAVAYNNNDGNESFDTDWTEENDDGSPSGGKIDISGSELRFQGLDGQNIVRYFNGSRSDTITYSF